LNNKPGMEMINNKNKGLRVKRCIIFIFAALFIIVLPLFADFNKDEKPLWGMFEDTAYNLHAQEYNIDMWGPITYGITDNIQAGTELLEWLGLMVNANCKYNFLPETKALPAVSIGGAYLLGSPLNGPIIVPDYTISHYSTPAIVQNSQLSLYLTKQINQQYYLNLFYQYDYLNGNFGNDYNYVLTAIWSKKSNSSLGFSFISDQSKMTRLSAEAVIGIGNKISYNAGAGFEFAFGGTLRMKIGIYSFGDIKQLDMPFIDLHWRFSEN